VAVDVWSISKSHAVILVPQLNVNASRGSCGNALSTRYGHASTCCWLAEHVRLQSPVVGFCISVLL
jgi:hypothetical protein